MGKELREYKNNPTMATAATETSDGSFQDAVSHMFPQVHEDYDPRTDTKCILTDARRVQKGLNDNPHNMFTVNWAHRAMAQRNARPLVRIMGHLKQAGAAKAFAQACHFKHPTMTTVNVRAMQPLLLGESAARAQTEMAKVQSLTAAHTAAVVADTAQARETAEQARKALPFAHKAAEKAPAMETAEERAQWHADYLEDVMHRAANVFRSAADKAGASGATDSKGPAEAEGEGGSSRKLLPGISTKDRELSELSGVATWAAVAIVLDPSPKKEHLVWFLETFETLDDLYAWNKRVKPYMARYDIFPVRTWAWWDPEKRVHADTGAVYTSEALQNLHDQLDVRGSTIESAITKGASEALERGAPTATLTEAASALERFKAQQAANA